jgi:hypothetical protein
MKTNLNPQVVFKDPKGSTLLIQSSTQDATISIPRMIRWENLTLPNEWLLENVSKSEIVVTRSTYVDLIHQYLDGTVKINFSDLNVSSRIQRPLVIENKRNSFVGFTTTEGFKNRDKEIDDLLASASNLKLKSVANDPANSQISSTFYLTKTHPDTHQDDDSDPISPSVSDMNGPLPPTPPPPPQ